MLAKTRYFSIALLALCTFLFSCKQESAQPAAGKQTAHQTAKLGSSQEVGYVDDNGDFVPVSEDNLLDYYKSLGLLSADGSIASMELLQGTSDDGTTVNYLATHAVDGEYHSKIATDVTPYNGDAARMAVDETTCSCKSKGCTGTDNCKASTMGSCSCSSCDGEGATCEKTSTTTSSAAIRSFFVSIGVTN